MKTITTRFNLFSQKQLFNLLSTLVVIMIVPFTTYSCSSGARQSQDAEVPQQKIRVLFDTDTNNEIDDQHALAYLLFNSNIFDVEGITVNSTKEPDVDLDYAEAERILKLCKAYGKVPLYEGADRTFAEIEGQVKQSNFEGASAVNFIIEEAMAEQKDELILLAVGKLTNIALALKKEPAIASKTRLVWLGSNYPESGEHNQNADTTAMNYLLNSDIPFEMVTVRYGKPSGTDAVKVTLAQIQKRMPGTGPAIETPVTGRHGGSFQTFGDYAVNLFENYTMGGDPPSRPLFDMAAVAILKDPSWAETRQIPAPVLDNGEWRERPTNPRTITLWEHFDIYGIMNDFFITMENPVLIMEKQ